MNKFALGAVLTRHQATPQQVYDGCFTVVEHVVESVQIAGTVRRLILTSSFSAVSHPADEGYVYTEKDRSGELFTWQLRAKLKELFPAIPNIGGEEMNGERPKEHTFDKPRAYCTLVRRELGLRPYSIDESLRGCLEDRSIWNVLAAPWKLIESDASYEPEVRERRAAEIEDSGRAEQRVRSDYSGRFPIELLQNA